MVFSSQPVGQRFGLIGPRARLASAARSGKQDGGPFTRNPLVESQLPLFPPDLLASVPPPAAVVDVVPWLENEFAQVWGLPLGRFVRITLCNHQLPVVVGHLKLARLPDLPPDPRVPLALRIARNEFSSRQIMDWSAAD